MCNIDNSKVAPIYAEVTDWMSRGKMFTSVDISNSLKEKGFDIRNREVAEYLRNYYSAVAGDIGEDYRQESIEVQLKDGSYATAFLYLPSWEDPDRYTTRNQEALPPKGRVTYTQNDEPDPRLNKVETADEASQDMYSTYWRDIEPKVDYIRAVEAKPTQNVTIHIHSVDTLVVTPNSEMNIDSHTEECVEED